LLAIPSPFRCEVSPDRDRVIVRLVGELDLAEAPAVARTLEEILGAGFERLVIDLRDLSFLDSSGLRTLLSAHHAACARNARMSLIVGSSEVRRLLELTAADSLFTIEDPASLR
jgi:anti-sigma B factor antagonist